MYKILPKGCKDVFLYRYGDQTFLIIDGSAIEKRVFIGEEGDLTYTNHYSRNCEIISEGFIVSVKDGGSGVPLKALDPIF